MLTPEDEIAGDGDEDTRLLREMAVKARAYITSFHWCLPVRTMYFVDGVGKIVALFLFGFEGKIGGTDEMLWVVVGDVPSVYMIAAPEGPDNAKKALEAYCELMDDWVNAVLVTHDFEGVFPVDAAESPANATDLRSRLGFIRREILPHFNCDPIFEPDVKD
jgi:hypothetical protein